MVFFGGFFDDVGVVGSHGCFPFWVLFECVDDVCGSVDGHDACDDEVAYGCCEWDGWA